MKQKIIHTLGLIAALMLSASIYILFSAAAGKIICTDKTFFFIFFGGCAVTAIYIRMQRFINTKL